MAERAMFQTGHRVRTDTADNFVQDLIPANLLREEEET